MIYFIFLFGVFTPMLSGKFWTAIIPIICLVILGLIKLIKIGIELEKENK